MFEKIIFNRLSDRVDSLLMDNQQAYQGNRSCNAALTIFSNYIFNATDKPKGKVVAIFIDLKSAFNSVEHNLLVVCDCGVDIDSENVAKKLAMQMEKFCDLCRVNDLFVNFDKSNLIGAC